jgi:acetyl-CoA carboxylase carboxyltransferase component
MTEKLRPELANLKERLARTLDEERAEAAEKRHGKGNRTARENLEDLIDEGSWIEYGQLAVAAQRNRRELADLQTSTAADGVITGTGTVNSGLFPDEVCRVAVAVDDYSVLAGTQGFFHHDKLDRIFELAEKHALPVIMYTEGGGGRPGDTDVTTRIAGLYITSFATFARLSGIVPRIAVNNGYCFAGNAVFFGCADITIATRNSWIGMAGPAMIEYGGLGRYEPTEIGPTKVQAENGVIDLVAEDEADATRLARQLMGYFQGTLEHWQSADQTLLRDILPADRRWGYPVRKVIETLADAGTFLELRRAYGRGMVTGFIRIEGRPLGLIANDCQQLGGAVDAVAAEKAARFVQLCDAFDIPLLSLTDTPGFLVGPENEEQAAVRRMSSLFVAGANISTPLIAIILRKGYGLGAMSMCGGSFHDPVYTAAWPTGEIGAMGLEGAVRLGYRKELEAAPNEEEREALFESLLARMYEIGRATEAASYLEIDAVIDPADSRQVILNALDSARNGRDNKHGKRNFVDTW